MPSLFQYQRDDEDALRAAFATHRRVCYQLATGGGKCLGRGERVLMFDGSTRAVENLRPGEQLMGPDSCPRTIERVSRGRGQMVRVQPKKGIAWRCNLDHILTLVRCPLRRAPRYPSETGGQLVDVSVKDWMAWSKTKVHRHKLVRTGVDFPPSDATLPISPYFLGLLIGDGTLLRNQVAITTADPQIVEIAIAQASVWGVKLRMDAHESRCPTYHFTQGRSGTPTPSPLAQAIADLGLMDKRSAEKFIPQQYKTASRRERRSLLAGLIDSDGSLGHGYDFVSKSAQLASDICFLARSLGFSAYITKKRVKDNPYWRVSINGDLSTVPVLLERNRAGPRRQRKNVLHTGMEISYDGIDDFFGFTLDGDGRFLLADFTITHNTVVAGDICQKLRQNHATALILVHRKELVRQFVNTLESVGLMKDVGVIHPDYPMTPWAPIQVASIFSLARREITLDPYMIIVDEAHHARAKTWETVLERWPKALILGMTATPARLDGKGLGTMFDHLHCGPSVSDLVGLGRLVPMRTFRLPIGFNMKRVRTTAGDWNKKDLGEQAKDERIVANGVRAYQKYAPGKRGIFFGVTVDHSLATAKAFRAAGIVAEHVDANTDDKTRDEVMERFGYGDIQVLCNVDLVGEGFDCPACEVVIDSQHTKSITRYLQKLGRAMRTAPGKTEGIHLDLCGNIIHGLAEDERIWTLDQEDVLTQGEGSSLPPTSRLRVCNGCATVYKATLMACPTCGAPRDSRTVTEVDVELQEMLPRGKRHKGKPKAADLQRLIREARMSPDPYKSLDDIRAVMNYPAGWTQQMADLIGIERRV